MLNLDPISLTEHMAIVPMTCVNCQAEIEIGDDCFVDESAGLEKTEALIYCVPCVENYFND